MKKKLVQWRQKQPKQGSKLEASTYKVHRGKREGKEGRKETVKEGHRQK